MTQGVLGGLLRVTQYLIYGWLRAWAMTLNCSASAGAWKYTVLASNSASVVHGEPAGSAALRCLSWRMRR